MMILELWAGPRVNYHLHKVARKTWEDGSYFYLWEMFQFPCSGFYEVFWALELGPFVVL